MPACGRPGVALAFACLLIAAVFATPLTGWTQQPSPPSPPAKRRYVPPHRPPKRSQAPVQSRQAFTPLAPEWQIRMVQSLEKPNPWAGPAALALLCAYYFLVWILVARGPSKGVVMVLYEPAHQLSPATMRYLWRRGYDQKVFIAALLNMSAKGFLTIREQAGVCTLTPIQTATPALSPEEKTIANKLFEGSKGFDLTLANRNQIATAVQSLKLDLLWSLEKTYFRNNARYLKRGLKLSYVLLAITIVLAGGDLVERVFIAMVGAPFLLLWISLVGVLLYFAFGTWRLGARGETAFQSVGIIFACLLFPFGSGAVALLVSLARKGLVWADVVLMASVGLALLAHHRLKSPTSAGRRLLDQIEGFRLFLKDVEADRLKRLGRPDETPTLLEKYLPYAVALDLEEAWTARFSDLMAAAGQGSAAIVAGTHAASSPGSSPPPGSQGSPWPDVISGLTTSLSQASPSWTPSPDHSLQDPKGGH